MSWNKMVWIMFIIIILFQSCEKKVREKEIIRPVRYMPVYSTGGSRVRTFTGVAQAGIESKLSFKVSGTVQQIAVHVGDDVNKGQLIAKLDPNDYQLQVQQSEAALLQAQAQYRNANSNYERVRALYETNNASRSDLDAARSANESAKGGLKATEKQFEMAKLQLSYTRLLAPVSGAIAAVNVEVNENVSAGQPIVILTSGSQIEVHFSAPEVLISHIKENNNVNVSFDAITDKKFTGTITEVGVASIGMGTTYPVAVQLNEKDEAIRPGMAATVECILKSTDERERFLVPSHSVIEDRQGRFVYIVESINEEAGFGRIHRRPVIIGELTGQGIEIFEGLMDGDLVVTAGVSRIKDGLKVKM